MHADKLKASYLFSKWRCQKGLGVMQVMAAASVMFLIVYTMITLLLHTARQQKNHMTLVVLGEMQKKMTALLRDQSSWSATLAAAANTSLACLRDNSDCFAMNALQNRIVEILDTSGTATNALLTNLPAWSAPTYPSGGFTINGQKCSEFNGNADSGSDACPFTYKVIWETNACTAANCFNPPIRVTGRLLYNPGTIRMPIQVGKTSLLDLASDDPTKIQINTSISAGSLNDTTKYINDSNMGKYDVVVWRMGNTSTLGFRIVVMTPAGTGAGTCIMQPTKNFRTGWSESKTVGGYDPFNLVTVDGSYNITINKAGTYECDVMAAGRGVNAFSIFLRGYASTAPAAVEEALIGSSAGVAPSAVPASQNIQSTAEFDTSFVQNSDAKVYRLEQFCDSNPGTDGFGYAPPADQTTTASIACRLID